MQVYNVRKLHFHLRQTSTKFLPKTNSSTIVVTLGWAVLQMTVFNH